MTMLDAGADILKAFCAVTPRAQLLTCKISYSIPSHIPIGSCLLFREGCTIDSSTIADRNAFDFYDLNECSTTTNAKNLKG